MKRLKSRINFRFSMSQFLIEIKYNNITLLALQNQRASYIINLPVTGAGHIDDVQGVHFLALILGMSPFNIWYLLRLNLI